MYEVVGKCKRTMSCYQEETRSRSVLSTHACLRLSYKSIAIIKSETTVTEPRKHDPHARKPKLLNSRNLRIFMQ